MCDLPTVSGGVNDRMFAGSPSGSRMKPSCNNRLVTPTAMSVAGAPSSWNSSSASIKPTPRGWQRPRPSRLAKRRSSSRNSLPISALRSGSLRESSSRRDAIAIAQPTGWPRNVLVWIASPVDSGQARSITSARPTQAESGKPPVSALPRHRISGVTPKCSLANHRPVRPKPV